VTFVSRTRTSVIRLALCSAITGRISGAAGAAPPSIGACRLARNSAQTCSATSDWSTCLTTWAISSLLLPTVAAWVSIAPARSLGRRRDFAAGGRSPPRAPRQGRDRRAACAIRSALDPGGQEAQPGLASI
jgi:hypothetical protein